MIFISNDTVNEIFKKLMKEEFRIADYTKLNNQLSCDCGSSKDRKVKYGYISTYIKDMNPDKRDLLYKNADFCIKVTESNECNDILMQVINHIILEVPRANEFASIGEQTKRHAQQAREFRQMQRDFNSKIELSKTEFNNIKIEFNRFENRIVNIQNEFIGILSIFSAIIVTFFGGVQLLGQVLSNIKNTNFYILTMITIVIGLVLFNIIYMLLYTVSKIISKNIGVNIYKCENCQNKNRFICLISKYPTIFWYNSFSIFSFIIIFFIYNLDKYLVLEYIFNSFIWMALHGKYLNLCIIFLIIIVLAYLFYKYFFKSIILRLPNIPCISKVKNKKQNQNSSNLNQNNNYCSEITTTQDVH